MSPERLVERFHHLAIRMLRHLREVDEAGGFAGPRASAMSLLVFRGSMSLKELAQAEGVKAPTMSRLVKAMQEEGLVSVEAREEDQRRVRIQATARGRRLMLAARDRRLRALASTFSGMSAHERRALQAVVDLLEKRFATPHGG